MKTRISVLFTFGAVLSVFRILIIKNDIEPITGFYKTGSVFPTVFYVLLVLACAFAVLPLLDKRRGYKIEPQKVRMGTFGVITCVMLGISFAVSAVLYYFKFTSGTASKALEVVLMFASAVAAFLMLAVSGIIGKEKKPFEICYLMLGVSGWYAVKLIKAFKGLTTIVTISEYLLEVIATCALVLFFYYFSKALTGSAVSAYVSMYGGLSIILVFVAVIPKIYYYIIGTDGIFITPFLPEYIPSAVSLLFISVGMIQIYKALVDPVVEVVEEQKEDEQQDE
ncbi:MAG: hypothetical protein Q8865_06615 [Bacillota bacterium]|nr:hypothetical protein [Bacillota bacterium]